jgi:anion-transporting  ArsA/GET3 family ATPase
VTALLHVLLGAGGVGKTTLAAGYAIALARAGRRVGLLGIDPARRLQSVLGLTLPDREVAVPAGGDLHAALLCPEETLRRWAVEACPGPEARARLMRNAFFGALADRLAASADVLAAVRLAEWAENAPGLTDFVVDTAPGLNAVEFFRRPRSLTAFLEGRLVRWLRSFARARQGASVATALRGGARRALGGMARIAGTGMLMELADLLVSVEGMLETMLVRIERAQRWLCDRSSDLLLVTAVREDAAIVTRRLTQELAALGLVPRAVVVNRALSDTLVGELDVVTTAELPPEAAIMVRYARAYAAMQRRVTVAVAPLAPDVVVLPTVKGLCEASRLDVLAALGERLRTALASAPPHAEGLVVGQRSTR